MFTPPTDSSVPLTYSLSSSLPPWISPIASLILPVTLFVSGFSLSFLPGFSRQFSFFFGFLFGWLILIDFFANQFSIHHNGIPLIVCSIFASIAAIFSLLLHELTLIAFTSFLFSGLFLIFDSSNPWRIEIFSFLLFCSILFQWKQPKFSRIFFSSTCGAFLVSFGVDHFGDRGFTSILFQDSILQRAVQVDAAAAKCSLFSCSAIGILFLIVAILGGISQILARQLEETEISNEKSGKEKNFSELN